MGMLTLIAGGVGYLIVKGEQKDAEQDYRMTEQDTRISSNETSIGKTARILYKSPGLCPDDKDELRPLFLNTRSGNE